MVTNNSLNQRTEALVIAPTGVGTPDPTTALLQVTNNHDGITDIVITNNTNAANAAPLLSINGHTAFASLGCFPASYAPDTAIRGDFLLNAQSTTNGCRFQTDLSKKFFFEFGGAGANNFLLLLDDASGKVTIERTATSTSTSPILQFNVDGSDTWYMTSNRGSSNQFEFGSGGTIGSNRVIIATTDGGQYKGNNNNTAPAAGFIGEVLSSNVASGSGIALTTGTAVNVTTLTPTAGTWMIFGEVGFTGITTGTVFAQGVNTTSATLGTVAVNYSQSAGVSGGDTINPTPIQIIQTSGATVYYLVAVSTFTVSASPKAYGKIQAVRIA